MPDLTEILHRLRGEQHTTQEQLHRIEQAIAALDGAANGRSQRGSGRRTLSPAARERIATAQRLRWARTRAKGPARKTTSNRRTLSPAARRRIAAAQKRRWAKVRAAKKRNE